MLAGLVAVMAALCAVAGTFAGAPPERFWLYEGPLLPIESGRPAPDGSGSTEPDPTCAYTAVRGARIPGWQVEVVNRGATLFATTSWWRRTLESAGIADPRAAARGRGAGFRYAWASPARYDDTGNLWQEFQRVPDAR